jgi:hypothetical protein
MLVKRLLTLLLCVMVSSMTYAKGGKNEPLINEVFVDMVAGQIIITGINFEDSEIFLGDYPDPLPLIQDVEADLIIAGLPAGITAGDYQLLLSQGKRGEDTAEHDLTIGAVGLAGPPGQDGVSGYEIVTSDRDVSGVSGALGGLSVDCPAGKKALGGGGSYVTSSGVPVSSNVTQITTTAPKADGSGWMITYLITASPPGDITAVRVYATCVTVL